MLAGTLPAWAAEGAATGPAKECTAAVQAGQDVAVSAVEAWKKAAAPGLTFEKNRRAARGLLQLVVRLWRERVEHDKPGLSVDEDRWRVRRRRATARRRSKRPQHASGARAAQNSGSATSSSAADFAKRQRDDLGVQADSFTWSPWHAPKGKTADKEKNADTGDADKGKNEHSRWW